MGRYKEVRNCLFLLFFFLLSACRNSDTVPDGHFEGSLLERKGAQVVQQPVSTDFVFETKSAGGRVEIRDIRRNLLLTAEVSEATSSGFLLKVPGILSTAARLQEDSGCYANVDEIPPGLTVRFCYSNDRFLLEILDHEKAPIFALTGDRFAKENPFEFEQAQNISLSGAIQRAMKSNFDSRIQFEHVMQAKNSAKAAYLNLLPHISLNSILSVSTPSVMGVLTAIGDLVPFLLPTRWFQAREAKNLSRAEADALLLMQADLATEIEGLSYTVQKDQSLQLIYKKYLGEIETAKSRVEELEKNQGLPAGSTDHVIAAIQFFRGDIYGLDLLLKGDKAALAQALGFRNPEAVLELTFEPESRPIDQAVALNHKDVTEVALSRSFELRQIDYLIQVARDQKRELYFNWLDPAGDYQANLGFALGAQIAVGQSRINELITRRQQIQQSLAQKIYKSVLDYNQALATFKLNQQSVELSERRLKRMIDQIQPGSGLNTMDIFHLVEECVVSEVQRETAIATYRIARSKIDRFLLQGFYMQLPRREKLLMNLAQ